MVRIGLYLAICLAAGMVQGAARASRPAGIVRHGLRAFVALAGGIALLCLGIRLLMNVTQG